MPEVRAVIAESRVYPGGIQQENSPNHKGTNDISVILAQMMGRNQDKQPEPIDVISGALLTSPGLYGQMGTTFLYYVRGSETGTPEFVLNSEGRVKKIVTIPSNSTSDTIIRVTTFLYQNPTFPYRVTCITDYEEARSFYEVNGTPTYDANSAIQNNIHPN